jgi:hypothetical protein
MSLNSYKAIFSAHLNEVKYNKACTIELAIYEQIS